MWILEKSKEKEGGGVGFTAAVEKSILKKKSTMI